MENWITVLAFTYPVEAHMAQGFLESEGIGTKLKDELTVQVNSFYSNAVGGVKLQVRENDYDEALMILQKGGYIVEPGTATHTEVILVDETTNKNICPFCQSENIGKNKDLDIFTIIVYFILGAFIPIFKSSYRCFDCEKEWKFKKL